MPMIMASAVISTGRNRVKPASSAAVDRVVAERQALAREAHHQDAVRRRHAHAHDRAGQRRHRQRREAWRTTSRRCPASAAGSAVMMTNGSIQD